MCRTVIACYKPKLNKDKELKDLVRDHHKILLSEGLVSERDSMNMEAKDGTIVEVFEWLSQEAIEEAHTNLIVQEMWLKFDELCDLIPVGNLAESSNLFSEFSPYNKN